MCNDVEGVVVEAIRLLDDIASGKGVRAAERRSALECKKMLLRLLRSIRSSKDAGGRPNATAAFATVARVCELLNAYLVKRNG